MDEETRRFVKDGLSDFRLRSIAWSENGEDLWITLREPGTSPPTEQTLVLAWVTDVSIHIDFGEYAGMPLMFESRFEPLSHERWICELMFGAAPDGYIRCECNQISLGNLGIDLST